MSKNSNKFWSPTKIEATPGGGGALFGQKLLSISASYNIEKFTFLYIEDIWENIRLKMSYFPPFWTILQNCVNSFKIGPGGGG